MDAAGCWLAGRRYGCSLLEGMIESSALESCNCGCCLLPGEFGNCTIGSGKEDKAQ